MERFSSMGCPSAQPRHPLIPSQRRKPAEYTIYGMLLLENIVAFFLDSCFRKRMGSQTDHGIRTRFSPRFGAFAIEN